MQQGEASARLVRVQLADTKNPQMQPEPHEGVAYGVCSDSLLVATNVKVNDSGERLLDGCSLDPFSQGNNMG